VKIRALIALLALCGATAAGAATQSNDYGSFSVSYDDSSVFGSPSFSFTSSDGSAGFGWNMPTSLNVASFGSTTSNSFAMPDFTITAKTGYKLSGLTGLIGNLVFTEVGGGDTKLSVSASLSVDGGPSTSFSGNVSKVTTASMSGFQTGYFADSASPAIGSFSSFSLSKGVLTLSASGPQFAAITSTPQNELKFSLIAAAVPEPESYAMFLAGLGLIGAIARRGKHHA
jgi:hypothetical protein